MSVDEINAYAVKINGVYFVSMDAAKSIVDEARQDSWNKALEEAAKVADDIAIDVWTRISKEHGPWMRAAAEDIAAAIRALKE